MNAPLDPLWQKALDDVVGFSLANRLRHIDRERSDALDTRPIYEQALVEAQRHFEIASPAHPTHKDGCRCRHAALVLEVMHRTAPPGLSREAMSFAFERVFARLIEYLDARN